MTSTPTDPGLCLVAAAERGTDWLARIAAVLDGSRASTLILKAPHGGAVDVAAAGPLVEMAQGKNVAVLIADDVSAARAMRADGVHLSWRPEIEDAYEAARAALGPDAIVGAEAGESRHDAMTLGEAGADYVAFGLMLDADEPEAARRAQRDLVAWCADVFVVPVVAMDAETADDVRDFARLGADFVAVRMTGSGPAENAAAWASALVVAVGAA
jgi:thiamine-phosphate pyrophosphorylase